MNQAKREDVVRRRRSIYTGLYPFMDSAKLHAAMKLWQEQYADKPSFALSAFLAAICDTATLKSERTAILTSVLKSMDLPEQDLMADPFEKTMRANTKTALSPELIAHRKMFFELMSRLLLKLEGKEESVKSYLMTMLNQVLKSPEQQAEIKQWLINHEINELADINIHEMRKLINLTYVCICEWEGPVRADQLLAQAVQETEPLAKQLEFKLQTLL